ncbi:MAG: 50S ribosomal protein L18 [Owenweeksia sp.]|nr:50S ribosomal protein L18 [Owenweeksia sp.]
MALTNRDRRKRIKSRVRKHISGTADRPRLTVYRSNKEIYAQVINDINGETLVAASSIEKETKATGSKSDVAKTVGQKLAEKAVAKGLGVVAFDRNGYRYHGRVKSLAEGARGRRTKILRYH